MPDVTKDISPWCALFSEDNLKILDFNDDLVFYQIGGYGHDINWKMTKPLVTELLTLRRLPSIPTGRGASSVASETLANLLPPASSRMELRSLRSLTRISVECC